MAGDAAPSARQRPTGPGRPPPGLLPVRPRATTVVRPGAATTVTVAVALATGTADGPVAPAGHPRAVGGTRAAVGGAGAVVAGGTGPRASSVLAGAPVRGTGGTGAVPVAAARVGSLVGTLSSTGACSSVVLTARGTVVAAAGAAGTRAGGPARPVGRRTVPLPVIAPPGAGIGTAPLARGTTVVSCLVPAGTSGATAGPGRSWRPALLRPPRPRPRAPQARRGQATRAPVYRTSPLRSRRGTRRRKPAAVGSPRAAPRSAPRSVPPAFARSPAPIRATRSIPAPGKAARRPGPALS